MILGTVTSKGQITIPLEMRNKFNIKPGTRVSFEAVDNQIVCKKVEDLDIEYLRMLDVMVGPEWTTDEDSIYDDL